MAFRFFPPSSSSSASSSTTATMRKSMFGNSTSRQQQQQQHQPQQQRSTSRQRQYDAIRSELKTLQANQQRQEFAASQLKTQLDEQKTAARTARTQAQRAQQSLASLRKSLDEHRSVEEKVQAKMLAVEEQAAAVQALMVESETHAAGANAFVVDFDSFASMQERKLGQVEEELKLKLAERQQVLAQEAHALEVQVDKMEAELKAATDELNKLHVEADQHEQRAMQLTSKQELMEAEAASLSSVVGMLSELSQLEPPPVEQHLVSDEWPDVEASAQVMLAKAVEYMTIGEAVDADVQELRADVASIREEMDAPVELERVSDRLADHEKQLEHALKAAHDDVQQQRQANQMKRQALEDSSKALAGRTHDGERINSALDLMAKGVRHKRDVHETFDSRIAELGEQVEALQTRRLELDKELATVTDNVDKLTRSDFDSRHFRKLITKKKREHRAAVKKLKDKIRNKQQEVKEQEEDDDDDEEEEEDEEGEEEDDDVVSPLPPVAVTPVLRRPQVTVSRRSRSRHTSALANKRAASSRKPSKKKRSKAAAATKNNKSSAAAGGKDWFDDDMFSFH